MEANDPRKQAEAKKKYAMPRPSVGPCVWRSSPTSTDVVPAIITQIGDRSVNLSTFMPENRGLIPMDGVRHISDPELADNPDRISGCWDFTEEQVMLRAIAEHLGQEEVRKSLIGLEAEPKKK